VLWRGHHVENPSEHKLGHIPFLHSLGSILPCTGNICEGLAIWQALRIHLSLCHSPLWACSTSITFPRSPGCQRLNACCYAGRSSSTGETLKNVFLYFPAYFSFQSTAHCLTHFLFEKCVSFGELKASPEGDKIAAGCAGNV